MKDLTRFYFEQNLKKSCSAQSVAVIYNYLNPRDPISDIDLLEYFPRWKQLIRNSIGIDNLASFVSLLFDTEVITYHRPLSSRILKKNIQSNFVIIYYNKHYSPILKYYPKTNEVLIGRNRIHDIIRINLKKVPIDSYLTFNI